ncbi:ABC transporter ATP-binding protein [Collinsella sp. AGMB00827]|uniref:ABC transporter ATP-binding protein n=1 Tax=Collinsella ureilytica TaxID=2869515 RepID=A0ABS7MJY0_9ACTN|nr:ABC transporter ATP-binding protein [Collinsella urealyticum]MBY4797572.1 ABC transporter ATP-binding protein [Collinsella urealyticum]
MKQLELEQCGYRYHGSPKPILEGVSFSAAAGEVTTLLGVNGAGKSTALRSIANRSFQIGRILLDERDVLEYSADKYNWSMGYLTQDNANKPALTVFDVVLLGKISRLGLKVSAEDEESVWKTLEALHLEPLAGARYNALSGGQRKVVGIAQTIVREPKILLLDEPTANLDIRNELEVMQLISAYTKARNTITLITLHDLNLATQFSDKTVLMRSGGTCVEGTPSEVLTEELILDVYGVEASVTLGDNNMPHIHLKRSVRESTYTF